MSNIAPGLPMPTFDSIRLRDSTSSERRGSRLETLQTSVRSLLSEIHMATPSNASGPSSLYSATPRQPSMFNHRPSTRERSRDEPLLPLHLPTNGSTISLTRRSSSEESQERRAYTEYSPMTQPSAWYTPSIPPVSRASFGLLHLPQPSPAVLTPGQTHFADRHPADRPYHPEESTEPRRGRSTSNSSRRAPVDPEITELASTVRRSTRKRRKRGDTGRFGLIRQHAWVQRGSARGWCGMAKGRTRTKCFACVGSGVFLAMFLAIYLTLALTHPHLGQEIHVLFILLILGTTIFFCHALIRLVMLSMRPPPPRRRRHQGIPEMLGPGGYEPAVPIRVILARDEEILEPDDEEAQGIQRGSDALRSAEAEAQQPPEKGPKIPPPAYGLWRSSVRLNPTLLHWARAPSPAPPTQEEITIARLGNHPIQNKDADNNGSAGGSSGPRPPSYISDDGVGYVVHAAPRSTVIYEDGAGPMDGPGFRIEEMRTGEVHPALR
ncbi:hypothetical protein K402DRAFT_405140 [Aulographum hederae CBS 113979]|uniref:Uncharacterized protein n=1 Tax=Aulographum hederae CBS 113979 TaxID=1176131 RepID=A0A6G1GXK7_9PEZI|nr:hypothetical protein K402DRAFT_405140 [Aulographum hederae CBS 113979]